MVMTKASDVISDRLMLSLSVTCILPTNISVGEKMPDVMLKLKCRETCLKCRLEPRALVPPTLLILWRVERQRDKLRQLRGDKLRCGLICW